MANHTLKLDVIAQTECYSSVVQFH